MTRFATSLTALAALAFAACEEPAAPPDASKSDSGGTTVYAVNYPLAWMAERIGGAEFVVSFPAPPDIDPAYWSPDGETVSAYQNADLILLNGAAYARWTYRATLPRATLVDTSAGFESRLVPVGQAITHGHGPQGAHTHGDVASTTWLDPTLAIEQARAITEALVTLLPDRESEIRARFEALASDWMALDARLAVASARLNGAPILFSHPVYQYLRTRYGLNGRSLHWEPGEDPGESEWESLAALLAEHPARILLWEGPPAPETAARLAGLGVKSFVFDPSANRPSEGGFLEGMDGNAKSLEDAAVWAEFAPSESVGD